ncbi:MAG: PhoH family protein [Bacilli bacterium]|nr:PhoH family protein [Bacilli bacterium]
MKKKYVIDTNVLLDDHKSIEILRNGVENEIFIPRTVLDELDGLKKNAAKRQQVLRVMDELELHKDHIQILDTLHYENKPDNKILEEITLLEDFKKYTFVTNDRLFRLKAEKEGVDVEPYKTSNPFMVDSERYTGFIELYNEHGKVEDFSKWPNSFHFSETKKLMYYSGKEKSVFEVPETLEAWKIKGWDVYQRALMQLLLDDDVLVTSVMGNAGCGKSLVALACALHLVLQEKKHKKIYITTSNVEATSELGFRPGDVNEKFGPLIRHMRDLLLKLHEIRPANKLFIDPTAQINNLEFNPRVIELIPLNFLRGCTLENAVVILDEAQNLSKTELRTLTSRCGDNVKFIATGDLNQIDNHYLSKENNGLNWLVRSFQGDKRYGHLKMSGKRARGPICEMTNELMASH